MVRCWRSLSAAMMLLPATALASAPSQQIEVVGVRSALTSGERIGAKRTGQLCLPAGSTLWGDAAPDWSAIGDAVAAGLRARGLDSISSATAADEPPPATPRRRLSVIVLTAHIDACVPQYGLVRLVGGRKKLKVSGTLSLRWRLADPSGGAPAIEREATRVIDANNARTLPDAVSEAIVAAVPAAVANELAR